MAKQRKPRIAVWKFASCDGCQLSILDCETDLLEIASMVDFVYFREATRATARGPYDVSLVEGSITTPQDLVHIKDVRKKSRYLVALGACATAGGIQALRNNHNIEEYISSVYAHPEYIDTMRRSSPISDYVPVDLELRGCPVNKAQLVNTLSELVHGRLPVFPQYSVCVECKQHGQVCVAVTRGERCLGPVTCAGCGAICPSFGRACYGCFGPKETPNTSSLSRWWMQNNLATEADVYRLFRTFNTAAPDFDREAKQHGEQDQE